MAIYIKDMEMPKSCWECGIEQEGFWCGVLDGYQNTRRFANERRDDCPLIEVPDHGELIDKTALLAECEWANMDDDTDVRVVRCDVIKETPTVIPQSEKRKGEMTIKVSDNNRLLDRVPSLPEERRAVISEGIKREEYLKKIEEDADPLGSFIEHFKD